MIQKEDKFIQLEALKAYGSIDTISDQAMALVKEQKNSFDWAKNNYADLDAVLTKTFDFDGFTIKVQCNPARIRSSNAKTDAKSIAERPCFLCLKNLPQQQKGIPILTDYMLLINPFPIFKSHLTIPSFRHQPQQIKENFEALLQISKQLPHYTVFYNGPQCGASAPDHLHLQAGIHGVMPIDNEVKTLFQTDELLINTPDVKVLKQKTVDEPMLNILSMYENEQLTVVVFPREKQRPSHFYKEGNAKIVIGPGSVEMGGLVILPRKEDYLKITKKEIQEIYEEITINSITFEKLKQQITKANS